MAEEFDLRAFHLIVTDPTPQIAELWMQHVQ